MLRLIFDCRLANLLCRDPPRVKMANPGALANLRFPHQPGSVAIPYDGHVGAIDFVDSFYLFEFMQDCPWLSELFALEMPFKVSEVGIEGIAGDNGEWIPLDANDDVWACLSTLPMGWKWSLLFCQRILVECMLDAGVAFGMGRSEALGQLLEDPPTAHPRQRQAHPLPLCRQR